MNRLKLSVVSFAYPRGIPEDSVYLAERFAERLAGPEGVDIEVKHTARPYWTA